MDEALEREEQIGTGVAVNASGTAASLAPGLAPLEPADQQYLDGVLSRSQSAEFQALIARVMDGSEPLSRPLKPNESKTFKPLDIQAVMLRLAGFKPPEICGLLSLDYQRVMKIFRHPYASRLIQALLPNAVADAVSMKATMERYAQTFIHHLANIGLTTDDHAVAARIGFGILDRAGYQPVQRAVIKHDHRLRGAPEAVSRLTQAVELARQSREITPSFTLGSRAPVREGEEAPLSEQSDGEVDVSPNPSSPLQEEVAA